MKKNKRKNTKKVKGLKNKRKKQRIIIKKKRKTIVFCLLVIFYFLLIFNYIDFKQNAYIKNINKEMAEKLEQEENNAKKLKEQEQSETYNKCLNESYNDADEDESIKNLKDELSSYLDDYDLSVYYVDPNLNFNYVYNEDKLYYAASLIKMVDALYIYENASAGNLNLDTKVTYEASNVLGDSKEMQNYKIGSEVSLRDLVKYAITVSDNTAHDILIDYIGFNNLKNFGKSLGAGYTLVGGDEFGEITVDDAIIYLKELNKFINNDSLGSELKDYFINSEQNYLSLSDYNILAAEKYGEYGAYYHENGIVYAPNPYLISILTTEGYNDYENIIRTINNKIYILQNKYYEQRKTRCYSSVYE